MDRQPLDAPLTAPLDAPLTAQISIGLDRETGVNRFEGEATLGRGVADMARARETLLNAKEAMKAAFGLAHMTIQIEDQSLREAEGELRL